MIGLISVVAFLALFSFASKFIEERLEIEYPYNQIPPFSIYLFFFFLLLPFTSEVQRLWEDDTRRFRIGNIITSRANNFDYILLGLSISLSLYFFWLLLKTVDKRGDFYIWRWSTDFDGMSLLEGLYFLLLFAVCALIAGGAGHLLSLAFISL